MFAFGLEVIRLEWTLMMIVQLVSSSVQFSVPCFENVYFLMFHSSAHLKKNNYFKYRVKS